MFLVGDSKRKFSIQIVVFFVACKDSIAHLTFNPRKKHDLWRFFTYHAVHYSFTHLLLNVVLQVKHFFVFKYKSFQNFSIFKPSPLEQKSLLECDRCFYFSNCQILIAVPLETEQGHFRMVIVYFIGVGFGAVGSMLFDTWNQTIIGSSAGVYSLLFSHLSQCFLVSCINVCFSISMYCI